MAVTGTALPGPPARRVLSGTPPDRLLLPGSGSHRKNLPARGPSGLQAAVRPSEERGGGAAGQSAGPQGPESWLGRPRPGVTRLPSCPCARWGLGGRPGRRSITAAPARRPPSPRGPGAPLHTTCWSAFSSGCARGGGPGAGDGQALVSGSRSGSGARQGGGSCSVPRARRRQAGRTGSFKVPTDGEQAEILWAGGNGRSHSEQEAAAGWGDVKKKTHKKNSLRNQVQLGSAQLCPALAV